MKKLIITTIAIFLVTLIGIKADILQTPDLVEVSGTVMEETSDANTMIGVSVTAYSKKGIKLRYATVSDFDGNFKIKVPVGTELRFTYMGYDTTKYKVVKEAQKVNIYMKEHSQEIKETVIVGYRKVSKADVTSAATVINTKDLAAAPVSNAMELLQGRVAGLNIQMDNGSPGSLGTITIRGVSDISTQAVKNSDGSTDYTLSSSAPLFVIDGIPQEDVGEYNSQGLLSGSGISPISSVPFEDIDNIQVLKDAAATSLYGSRGAYGVVLIETKKGNSGKPRITYSMDMKANIPPRLRDVIVGRSERMQRIEQILQNDTSVWHGYRELFENQALTDSLNPYYNNHTDWQGQFYRRTLNTTHNIQVSGGTTAFNYKINGNYYTEKGIIKNTDFDRYSLRTNMGYRPSDKFDLYAAINVTLGKQGSGSGNALAQTGVASGSSASSLLPPPSIYSASNAALGALMVESGTNSLSYDASMTSNYQIAKNIRWNGTVGYSYSNSEYEAMTPGLLNKYNAKLAGKSTYSNRYYVRTGLDWGARLWMFNLGLNVGVELSSKKSTENNMTLSGLSNDYIWGPFAYAPGSSSGATKRSYSDNTLSFTFAPRLGIGSKAIGDRYVFNPSLRPEANSAYGKKVKWVVNPGLGFKWNYSMEPFMKKATNDWLDYGALRVSWGRTTKYKADRYDVWGTYNIGNLTYNGNQVTPISYDALPNYNLNPVTTTQWNIGTDLTVLKHKLSLTADAYYKQVDNQLSSIELADHNAFSKIKTTEVSLVNYGLELAINATPINSKNWYLSASWNMAINRDVLTKLPNDARMMLNSESTIVNKLGINALSNYLYVYKGVYATDEDVPVDPKTGKRLRVGGSKISADNPDAYFRAGDPIWVDLNGDYVIDEKDKMIVGNSQPRVTGGLSLNVRYKNFSVFTSFSYTLKRDIINKVLADNFAAYANPATTTLTKNAALTPIDAYNFWTPSNTNADYPNPFDYKRYSIIQPYRADQTLFQEDGSYFKINGITLSWKFPQTWTRFLGVSNVSLRANLSNIYTFSNYSGVNPESVNNLGQDKSGGYPNARSFSFGLNVGF